MNHPKSKTIGLPRGAFSEIARQLHVDPLLVSRIARALLRSMNQTINRSTTLGSLPYGTLTKIARRLDVHPSVISRVARGLNTSARVTAAIEAERRMILDNGRRSNAQTVTHA